jgi:hypothetical protein
MKTVTVTINIDKLKQITDCTDSNPDIAYMVAQTLEQVSRSIESRDVFNGGFGFEAPENHAHFENGTVGKLVFK